MSPNFRKTAPHNGPMSVQITLMNTYAAKFTIIGWVVGLAYYNWLASNPSHVPFWAEVVLTVIGAAVVCVVVGGAIAILLGCVTKLVTGDFEGSADFYGWGAVLSPIAAFSLAGYALDMAARI